MKILSVDDKVENLYLLESILRGAGCGYEVVSAHNGVEALQKLDQEKFDLIISDILMPQMDGFELCRHVKERDDLRHIPFIFYTATYTEKKDQQLGLGLGASRFIIKPLEPENFLAVLREVIGDYQAGRLGSRSPAAEKAELLLEAYNRRLVRKLDQKVQQLEQVAQQRQAALEEKEREVVERRKAEEALRRANAELEARVQQRTVELRRLNEELELRVAQRTAELTAANRELNDFATIVSHDLKTPLRGVATLAKWLQSDYADKLDPEGREHLAEIVKRTTRMDRMLDDTLQYSHLGRGQEKSQPVALAELVPAVVQGLAPPAQVRLRLAPGLPVVQGEPVRLRQLFQNLIGNAIKHGDKTPVEIQVGWADSGSLWQFSVADNGPGIEERHFERIFQIFQTLAPKDKTGSTGAGLALVKRIVERAGGRVWVESRLGEGSIFHFTWPKGPRARGAEMPVKAERMAA